MARVVRSLARSIPNDVSCNKKSRFFYLFFLLERATCKNIKCMEGQTCLTELSSQKPRCVTCFIRPKWCKVNSSRVDAAPTGPICSTNGKTYKNWCEMTEDACSTGVALDTNYFGECRTDNSTIFNEEENELLH